MKTFTLVLTVIFGYHTVTQNHSWYMILLSVLSGLSYLFFLSKKGVENLTESG